MLKNIKVADPAVGPGAFPLGMINEIVRARKVLNIYLDDNVSDYELKLHTISHSIYGVDIDPGAVEIARLRLWLSLVVEENEPHPLPNLEHKIMQGNSLVSEYEGIKLFDPQIIRRKAATAEGEQGTLAIEGVEVAPVQGTLGVGETGSVIKMQELTALIDRYIGESQRSKKESLKSQIDQLKWEFIEVTLREKGEENKLQKVAELRRKNIRPFFIWELEFSDVFLSKGGFDVVIGNPPYVGQKGNRDMFRDLANSSLGKRFYSRKMDLFYFFFHLGLDLLKNEGILGFITTNYFVTATSAQLLRDDLRKRSSLIRLDNFNELKIFKSAAGQHNMITMMQKGYDPNVVARTAFSNLKGFHDTVVIDSILGGSNVDTVYNHLTQEELYKDGHISLSSGKIDSVLDKIKKKSVSLSDICDINMGVQTGADSIGKALYQRAIDNGAKGDFNVGDDIYVLDDVDGFSSKVKKDLLKKHIKGSSISKYKIDLSGHRWLIYIDSQIDINDYPQVKKHLEKFRKVLVQREQVDNTDHGWYRIRGAKRKFFIGTGKHIICPYRAKSNNFAVTDGDTFGSGDVYLMTGIDQNYDVYALLGVLNSKLTFLWLYNRGKRKGDMLELYQQPLSNIPVPNLIRDKRYGEIMSRLVVDISKKEPNSNEFKKLQEKIDELVMDLYELTEGEKEIIRNS